MSQVEYLTGLQNDSVLASAVELHVICLHRFESDWRAFVDGFGSSAASAVSSVNMPQRTRNSRRPNEPSGAAHPLTSMQLSAAEREFVRQCLFPEDTLLVRQLCGEAAFKHGSTDGNNGTVHR